MYLKDFLFFLWLMTKMVHVGKLVKGGVNVNEKILFAYLASNPASPDKQFSKQGIYDATPE